MAFVHQLKKTKGYSPTAITYVDDGVDNHDTVTSCSDVIVTLLMDRRGKLLTKPGRGHPSRGVIWIYPGFSDPYWGRTSSQNPLYLHEKRIHLSYVRGGAILYCVGPGSRFDHYIRAKRGVYMNPGSDAEEEEEVHIHLTIEELNSL
jgi:hypothetical protein